MRNNSVLYRELREMLFTTGSAFLGSAVIEILVVAFGREAKSSKNPKSRTKGYCLQRTAHLRGVADSSFLSEAHFAFGQVYRIGLVSRIPIEGSSN